MRRIEPPLHPPFEPHGDPEVEEALREARQEIALGNRLVAAVVIVLGLAVGALVIWWLIRGKGAGH